VARSGDRPQQPTEDRARAGGGYRSGGPNTITDQGFTGHKENMTDLGLIYMNARFYAPNTNRFLTPDTIVPDPTNPQSFNRYSYTYNNPLRYNDPSGHCVNNYEAGSDDLNTCLSAWNAVMNYYTHIIYGPEGDGEWSEGLSNGTNEWLMNADIAFLESLMEGYGIDYGYTSDLPVPGLDHINDTGCVSVGSSIACPPEGGWPEYYPGTEEFAKKFIKDSVMTVLLLPIGPTVAEVTALEGVGGFIVNTSITFTIKRSIKSLTEWGLDELSDLPLTTDQSSFIGESNALPWSYPQQVTEKRANLTNDSVFLHVRGDR